MDTTWKHHQVARRLDDPGWRFQVGGSKLEVSGWTLQVGGFKQKASGWSFKLNAPGWRFQAGGSILDGGSSTRQQDISSTPLALHNGPLGAADEPRGKNRSARARDRTPWARICGKKLMQQRRASPGKRMCVAMRRTCFGEFEGGKSAIKFYSAHVNCPRALYVFFSRASACPFFPGLSLIRLVS